MADRSISISLEAKVAGFVAGMKTAAQATRDAESRLSAFALKNEQSFDRVGKASLVMGGGLVAGVGLAVKSFADFDKAMSDVQASTHETTGNMSALREAAIKAGADTAFSASEAAKGIDELAKAGVSTKDILNGGLNGALSLAAAGSMGVGDSAEIAATALTQFKLAGKDIPHVADLLAAGAGKAQGSVGDMGAALKQSGLVASQFGLSIEDTTGLLAAFASAGLVGSDSGTSLKTMLLKLASPSKEAAGMMHDLGIAAYDTTGKFVGVQDLAGQLQDKLGGLSQAQRDSTLATIFGTDAIRGANVLYEQGSKGIADWTKKVNDSGYAAETARIKQDNLAGDLEKLGGSFDTVLIQSGSGANDVLRGLTQGLEGLVDAVGKVPGPVLAVGTGMAAAVGGVGLLAGGLITVIPKIAETKAALEVLAPAGSKASGALSKAGAFARGAAAGITAVAAASALAKPALDQILKPTGETGDAMEAFAGQAAMGAVGADTLNKSFQDLVQHKDGVGDFQTAIQGIADPGVWGNIDNILVGGIKVLSLGMADVTSTSDKARERMKALGEQLASVDAEKAAKSFQDMAKATDGSQGTLKQMLDLMPAYRKSLEDQAKASGRATDDQTLLDIAMGKIPPVVETAATAVEKYKSKTGEAKPVTEAMATALADVGLSAQGAVTDIQKFGDSLFAAGLLSLSASDASIAYQDAIDKMTASVATNGQTLDLNTEAGRANQSAYNAIAKAAMTSAEAHAEETLKTQGSAAAQKELQAGLKGSYTNLITAANQLGITGDAADAMARKALGIPPKVNIDTWVRDHATKALQDIKGKADALDGKQVTLTILERTIKSIETQVIGGGSADNPSDTALRPGTLSPKNRAVGGAIIGPGTGTSDEIPALLSNGEHVLTAAEVQRMGGQAAVYRFRQMLDAGKLPKFATGGAIGGHLGESANARANRLYREQAAREKKTADEIAAAAKYRADQASSLNLDYARGQAYQSVNDSLSSAYSFSDRLRSVGTSGNVANGGALVGKANAADSLLRGLFSRSEKLAKSLDLAKAKLDSLVQVRDGIKSALSGEFKLGDAVKMAGTLDAKGVNGEATSVLTRIRGFAGKLKKLQQMGYSGAILQEIAGMGSEDGGAAADALLVGSKSDVKALNSTYTAIGAASQDAGTYVTDAMYKGGVKAAQGVVDGLTKQEKAIEAQMLKIGLSMENSLRSALGMKALHKAGGGRVYGPGTTTSDSVPHMLSKDEYVIKAAAAKAIGYANLDRMNNGDARPMKPVITYRPARTDQGTAGSGAPVTNNWHITEQSNPVATAHEVARRQFARAT